MKKFLMATVLGLGMTGFAVDAQAQDGSWVHLRVTEAEGATVSIDLPVSLVGMALEVAGNQAALEGAARFGQNDNMGLDDLRALWAELRDAGDGQFVDITEEGSRVRMFREGDRVSINAEEGDATRVKIEVPISVVDILLGDEGDSLDFVGALHELSRTGSGDIVEIIDGDNTVRAWVDNNGG
jgi:hypothetical protein